MTVQNRFFSLVSFDWNFIFHPPNLCKCLFLHLSLQIAILGRLIECYRAAEAKKGERVIHFHTHTRAHTLHSRHCSSSVNLFSFLFNIYMFENTSSFLTPIGLQRQYHQFKKTFTKQIQSIAIAKNILYWLLHYLQTVCATKQLFILPLCIRI